MATPSVTNSLVNGTTIDAPDLMQNFNDILTFLTNEVVHVDGTKAMTGNLDMGTTNRIVNLAAPVGAADAARNDHNHDADYLGATDTAVAATALETGRTISLTGDVTGTSAAFDGTGDVSITATVGNDSHTHGDSTINGLNASAVTAGTFATARIPSLDYISSTTPTNTAANSFAAHRVRNIWIGASTPSSTGRQTGDIWFDTSA